MKVIQTLQLNSCKLNEEEIKIDRARINGIHEGIKYAIEKIENTELFYKEMGFSLSPDMEHLKNELGILVYKHWPRKE